MCCSLFFHTKICFFLNFIYCCSVDKSCLTLCNHMDYSTLGLTVLHYPTESTQTHVHWISDAIQPSLPLPFCPQSFPVSGSFPVNRLFASSGQNTGASASASVLPVNIQDWFPLGWTGLISLLFKGLSRVFPSTTVSKIESIYFLALNLLYGPNLTSSHDCWKNHSFDYMDHCQQSDVSAF